MRINRRWAWVLFLVFVILLTDWYFFGPTEMARLKAGDVQSVEVKFRKQTEKDIPPPEVQTKDPEIIGAIIASIQTAKVTTDHKCGSRGEIVLRQTDGSVWELEFLPGHSEGWYEFRYGKKIFQVQRPALVNAMKRMGVSLPLDFGNED